MKVTVNEQAQRFYLAFDKWESVVGHEIKVGEFQFCAIPLSGRINISEVTSGMKIFDIPLDFGTMVVTATKEGSLEFFEHVGNRIKKIIERTINFDEQLEKKKEISILRLGEMPAIENVDVL